MRDEDLDALLYWCVNERASDITLQTDRPVYVEVDGKLRPATVRPLDAADLSVMLNRVYGAEALAKLASGTDLDLSYEIRLDRNTRSRFRVNITAILSRGRDSVQITMRVLPSMPPRMQDLGIEQEIIDAWAPRQGLVLVTGPTGSGKTTLLAAGCRMLVEREQGCGKMLTYEAPIEYVYDAVTGPHSLVSQSEIPRHLPSFADGVRNALRRKPNIILVGESRDRETVAAAIEAGQTGHLVYSTVHTIGVAATMRRMVSVFEPDERTERAFALLETMRLIVTQALVPKVGGGRVGVREWMAFDDSIRDRLFDIPIEHWTTEIQRLVPDRGRSMAESAKRLFEAGLIDKRWFFLLSQETARGG
ncbi:MAG TPA: ATPase [Rhodospirillaceae bacterium]|nr:ATPase [Rhodospirillaceae bacterium]